MVKDAEKTKARLRAAAVAEFAEFGIAGARIDRIASAARANKQMIYAYFGNKDQLFDEVFSTYVGDALKRVDFDAADLPGYAGRMFDYFENDPQALRLSTWYRLERPDGAGLRAVAEINRVRLQRLADAQRDGLLSSRLPPAALLALIQAITISWATMNPEFLDSVNLEREQRRNAVVAAVELLVDP